MISVPVVDTKGNSLQSIEVDEKVLGGKVRKGLLREAVQMYEMNRHVCTKGHLTRGEVSGSTRKMYKQKHTGNARAGQRMVPSAAAAASPSRRSSARSPTISQE